MIAAICDDDKKWRKSAEEILLKYGADTFREIDIISFARIETLLSYTGNPIDVVFLDIQLQDENGIEAARKIHEKWKSCQIVYVTDYIYYAMDVYATEHAFFTLKGQFKDRLPEIFHKLDHAWNQKNSKLIFLAIGGDKVVLKPEDIQYFERNRRVTTIKTAWGEYEIWDKLNDVMDILPKIDFVRCHNSYIVYLPAILEMHKDCFVLQDGKKITISRGYAKKVKETFTRWAFTQIS